MGFEEQYLTLLKSTDVKLEAVLTNIGTIGEKITNLEATVGDLNRTVRGYNGTPGLITILEIVKKDVEANKAAIVQHKIDEEKLDAVKERRTLTWKWLVESLGTPVVISIIVWLLLTVVPTVMAK